MKRPPLTPLTRTARAVEFHSGRDKHGDYTFTLYWWAEYHPGHPEGEHGWRVRGQVFHDDPQRFLTPGTLVREPSGREMVCQAAGG